MLAEVPDITIKAHMVNVYKFRLLLLLHCIYIFSMGICRIYVGPHIGGVYTWPLTRDTFRNYIRVFRRCNDTIRVWLVVVRVCRLKRSEISYLADWPSWTILSRWRNWRRRRWTGLQPNYCKTSSWFCFVYLATTAVGVNTGCPWVWLWSPERRTTVGGGTPAANIAYLN